ncbi:DUF3047 domain-containing protein [Elioraea tepidiphila]|uniref:DUF3047 domain-containing protein n=1 Tax=Elioraea tepidiphila TaxID=457934 RepID=UPI0003828842|nr:DUF3047 domain-containing protein [Elioraea tepidiphila]
MRAARSLGVVALGLTAGVGPAGAALDPGLLAQGWRVQPIDGRAPLAFAAEGDGAIRISGAGGVGIVFRPVRVPVSPVLCLSWRWRLEPGPETDLAGLVLQVGFEADGERMTLGQRYALGFARMMSRGRMVPGFALSYRWGGEAGEPAWHPTPLLLLLEQSRWRQAEVAPRGEWITETVALAAEFRAAYGIAPTAYVTEVAIGAQAGAAIEARIDGIAFGRCPDR